MINLSWEDIIEADICVAPGCPELEDPANGSVAVTGVMTGDTATFSCDIGHELFGSPLISCLSNATWNAEPPICAGMKM